MIEETPTGMYLRLYKEYKYNVKYGWSERSVQRLDNIVACILELEYEISII